MKASVQFYRDALGMELLYGGEGSSFSSLQTNDLDSAVLNLEQGDSIPEWGRLMFCGCGRLLEASDQLGISGGGAAKCFLGERYSHMRDPDGHELSFARPL